MCSVPRFSFFHRASGSYLDRFGAWQGYTGNFEQGFGAMGRPKLNIMFFIGFTQFLRASKGEILAKFRAWKKCILGMEGPHRQFRARLGRHGATKVQQTL